MPFVKPDNLIKWLLEYAEEINDLAQQDAFVKNRIQLKAIHESCRNTIHLIHEYNEQNKRIYEENAQKVLLMLQQRQEQEEEKKKIEIAARVAQKNAKKTPKVKNTFRLDI